MKPTDISAPDYFHKVVDCQWACPAHTPVPEYIRLIAAGRYSDAYMINWKSNVFPGILGRTCDRPCEPACRRVRVEKEPVAICRLKRVAADFKEDIRDRLPPPAAVKNGKRIALIGAGPASLTVARDLAPLGYHCVIFDQDPKAGGMIRTQIPRFRLPESIIDEECDYILHLGIEFRGGTRIDSLKSLLAENWDAIFVGSGAPRGRDLDIPGRKEAAANIHIGIDWLSSVSFGHIEQDRQARDRARRGQYRHGLLPLVAPARRPGCQGGGALRLRGDESVSLGKGGRHARGHPDPQFPRSKEFTHEDGRLTGVVFEKVKVEHDANGRRNLVPTGEPDQHVLCDDVLVAVGQENAFPWIERDIGIEFDEWDMPKVNAKTMASTHPRVFFGGDAAFGPKNIIWAVAHGHDAALSIDKLCHGEDIDDRPIPWWRSSARRWASTNGAMTTTSRPIGATGCRCATRWSLCATSRPRSSSATIWSWRCKEADRCLNCDVQTVFTSSLCIECDACVDICPMDCITFTQNGEEADLRTRLKAPAMNVDPGSLHRQWPQDRPHHGQGRGRMPALRPLCRALPDRRLGHEEISHRHDSRG